MKVRRPALDFSNTPPRWSPDGEFAQAANASSLWIPSLERFLNRVLARVLAQYRDDPRLTPELHEQIRIFIRQESNHTAIHDSFNAILSREGYDTAPFVKHFDEEFETMLRTKSLAFLTSYCEGFETFGPPSALAWFDQMDEILAGARPEVVDLWKWHLLEEYEHRTVCHDVFHLVHGGYFLRIYGFFYQMFHLGGFSKMVREHLLEVDRKTMTPEELELSRKREKKAARAQLMRFLPRLFSVLSPFYTPYDSPEPRGWKPYRDKIEADIARASA